MDKEEMHEILNRNSKNRPLLEEINSMVMQQVRRAIAAHALKYGSYDLEHPYTHGLRAKRIAFTCLDAETRDRYGIQILGAYFEESLFKLFVGLSGPKLNRLPKNLRISYWELIINISTGCEIRSYSADDAFLDWWLINCTALDMSSSLDELHATVRVLGEFFGD